MESEALSRPSTSRRRAEDQRKWLVASGSFAVMSGQAVLAFLLGIAVARMLGVEKFGVYSYVIALTNVFAVPAAMGGGRLAVRLVAAYKAAKDWAMLQSFLKAMPVLLWLASAVSALGMISVHRWILKGPASSLSVAVGAAALPAIAFLTYNGAVVQGFGRVVLGQVPESLVRHTGLLVLLGIVALDSGRSVEEFDILTRFLLATTAASLLAMGLRRRVSLSVPRVMPAPVRFRRLVGWSLPLFGVSMLLLINRNIETLLLASMSGAEQAGVFQAASRVAEQVGLVLLALGATLSPRIAALWTLRDREQLQALMRWAAGVTFVVVLPLTVLLFVFAPVVLRLFGGEFVVGSLPMRILLLGRCLHALSGPAAVLLMMCGMERLVVTRVGMSTLISAVLNVVLIPRLGAVGAAISGSVSAVAWAIACWDVARRRIGVDTSVLSLARGRG